jgi:hypothetical protein
LQKELICRLFAERIETNQNLKKIIIMKSLLIAFTILASSFTQPTFASEPIVTPTVLKTFETTFANAKDVSWTAGDQMFKAQFEYNGQVVTAYFSSVGNLVAVTRNITSHQLPLTLQAELKKGHENAWITNLFEVTNDEGTSYYATIETAENKVVLKSNGQSWSNYSKSKKD